MILYKRKDVNIYKVLSNNIKLMNLNVNIHIVLINIVKINILMKIFFNFQNVFK